MQYGLIGEHLSHSFSPEIHARIAPYSYELRELSPDKLETFILKKEFRGINITIPYKQTVIPFLDVISPEAQAIGAVNTVVNKNGRLFGYNTDYFGMKSLLQKTGISCKGKKVAILGTGGTSLTARTVAETLGAKEIVRVSRHTPPYSEKDIISYSKLNEECSGIHVIINTSPCGMYPHISASPVTLDNFINLTGLIDAIYNPLRTQLVLSALQRDIPASGGLYMLVAQAVAAYQLFFGNDSLKQGAFSLPFNPLSVSTEEKISPPPLDSFYQASEYKLIPETNTSTPFCVSTEDIYTSILQSRQNIVLCGMPSCGKTSVGQLVAEKLQKQFIDIDQLIATRQGKTPAEIISKEGEKIFRDYEAAVIDEIAPLTSSVISCGGGSVLLDANVEKLKANGVLFFIDRPLNELQSTADRPLSNDPQKLKVLYTARYKRYCQVADYTINGSGSLNDVVFCIISLINTLKQTDSEQ